MQASEVRGRACGRAHGIGVAGRGGRCMAELEAGAPSLPARSRRLHGLPCLFLNGALPSASHRPSCRPVRDHRGVVPVALPGVGCAGGQRRAGGRHHQPSKGELRHLPCRVAGKQAGQSSRCMAIACAQPVPAASRAATRAACQRAYHAAPGQLGIPRHSWSRSPSRQSWEKSLQACQSCRRRLIWWTAAAMAAAVGQQRRSSSGRRGSDDSGNTHVITAFPCCDYFDYQSSFELPICGIAIFCGEGSAAWSG